MFTPTWGFKAGHPFVSVDCLTKLPLVLLARFCTANSCPGSFVVAVDLVAENTSNVSESQYHYYVVLGAIPYSGIAAN